MDRARASIAISLAATAVLAAPSEGRAQVHPAGIVTTLQGSATLSRVALPQPRPLKLRDDVFVQDHVQTGDQSLARILLGGKTLITVREHSQLTITEVPGTSTIELSSGKIAVAAVKERMKPGEAIHIRTPNAVAAIRGTVLIAEVTQATAQAGPPPPGVTTTVTVIRGLVDFTPTDAARRPVGPTLSLGPLDVGRVTGGAPPIKRSTTQAEAESLSSTFRAGFSDAGVPSGMSGAVSAQQSRAASYVSSLLGPAGSAQAGATSPPSPPSSTSPPTTGAAVGGADDGGADDTAQGGKRGGQQRTREGLPMIDIAGNQRGSDARPEREPNPARVDIGRGKDLQPSFIVTGSANSGPSSLESGSGTQVGPGASGNGGGGVTGGGKPGGSDNPGGGKGKSSGGSDNPGHGRGLCRGKC